MTGNPIPDASLIDAIDDEHRAELVAAWCALHPGEPVPQGSIAEFLEAVNADAATPD